MKKSMFLFLAIVALMYVLVSSCKKTPPPTVEISSTTDGYTVTFNPSATNTDTYIWDFGDDEISAEANPVHIYSMSGTYTVTLTVKGEGGEATTTKEIILAPSLLELLTGGAGAASGKTWVLSTVYTDGADGLGPVINTMPITLPGSNDFLNGYGLETEYDNEFTFYASGNFTMNPQNGSVLAGAVYGRETGSIVGDPAYDIGMCAATFTLPASATWTIHSTNLTVDAITDRSTSDVPPIHGDVTFTGKKWISLSAGAYFGILDFPTTAMFIIKDITSSQMNVALFLCEYGYGDSQDDMMLPTTLVHFTFVPKTK